MKKILLLAAAAAFSLQNATAQTIDVKSTEDFSPYVFGHNLEHTRAAVNGGLSAQMLRNRKFAGKPLARAKDTVKFPLLVRICLIYR